MKIGPVLTKKEEFCRNVLLCWVKFSFFREFDTQILAQTVVHSINSNKQIYLREN